MKPKPRFIEIPLRHAAEANPVPIIADATVATALWGEGRTIPLLILDTSTRPDIENLVRAQCEFDVVGDATSHWSFKKRPGGLPWPILVLRFTKPSQCLVLIAFDIGRQGVLVDQILWSCGVYLQPGQPGDRLVATMKNPRILVEVPANEVFRQKFERIYKKAIYHDFRRGGMSRAQAKQSVNSYLEEWRDAFHRRVPFRRSPRGPDSFVPESADDPPTQVTHRADHGIRRQK